MGLRQILTTIVGNRIGLENGGALILNKSDGTQIVLDSGYTPIQQFKRSSPTASPLVSFTGATFGDLAPPDQMVIPGNTLKVGSRISSLFRFWKNGSNGSYVPTSYFGNTNNSSGQALSNTNLAAAATFTDIISEILIGSATSFTWSTYHRTVNVGVGGPTSGENTTKCDITQPMYLFSAFSSGNASDTMNLLGYVVQVFQ